MGEAVYPGNVPDSSSTTITTTWITRISDALPDSGLLKVLKSALLEAGGCPTQFLFVWKAAFASGSAPLVRDSGPQRTPWHSHCFAQRQEEPGILAVFRGGYGNIARNTSAQYVQNSH